MQHSKVKAAVKTVCLVLSLLLVFSGFHQVFRFKYTDGIYGMDRFYALEPNTVDVLNLGSSHMFVDVNPAVLWEDYGISSFNLGGSSQPLWNTYYYLKEALKTQTPKLLVLESFGASLPFEYSDPGNIIKNISALKPSANKLAALQVSVPEGEWLGYGLEFIQYHSRYKQLAKADFMGTGVAENPQLFLPVDENWMGGMTFLAVSPFEPVSIPASDARSPLLPKTEEYYRKIIELAQSEQIPILIFTSPYFWYSEKQSLYHEAAGIAEEYGVPFLNFNEDYAKTMDWSTDFADVGHMSYLGSEKFSHMLAGYLHVQYTLPDRRGDTDYAAWEENAAFYRAALENHSLTSISDVETYLNTLVALPETYLIFLSLDGNYMASPYDLRAGLEKLGVPRVDSGTPGAWVHSGGALVTGFHGSGPYRWSSAEENDDLTVDQTGLYCNRTNYKKVADGLNVLVYNRKTATVADTVGFSAPAGAAPVR
ncbi:hypothetical protein [uncultured Oscillibacter sp.]|uniref:hypothetical protein n=1 Tax=uncultured Oscillibacter sp. TaxID=876091 RepID=UPI0025DACDA7|nr:hypothetical protein [uncultured Oscillibacter sp.]